MAIFKNNLEIKWQNNKIFTIIVFDIKKTFNIILKKKLKACY